MEDLKKETVYLADGRKADKLVQEEHDAATGGSKITTEVWAEPKIDKKLTQKVVEYKKPVVYRRDIETVDETSGDVIERKVESLEPEVKMELREHIQSAGSVSALNVEQECDCHVTKQDLQDSLLLLAEHLKNKDEPVERVSALQAMIGDKVDQQTETSGNGILWMVIAALGAVFTYVAFF